MRADERVGEALVAEGMTHVFGVVGSGNFHLTNALVTAGARFVAARHEGGAATMADTCARIGGGVVGLSVHQGCGLTNALTGVAEAAKSRTPLLVLAPQSTAAASNFLIDQAAVARGLGCVVEEVESSDTLVPDAVRAYRRARDERRTILLNMPLGVMSEQVPASSAEAVGPGATIAAAARPTADATETLADLLRCADRPIFIAGRGARSAAARRQLRRLAAASGALLATTAVARGLFRGDPFDLDVAGGFATPLATELLSEADLIVAWGASLNMWTTRHGSLVGEKARVAQVDLDVEALGARHPVDLGLVGDVVVTAHDVAELLATSPEQRQGYRTPEVRSRIAAEGRWSAVAFVDESTETTVDPRALTVALDRMLPADRTVTVDSGHFMGWPSMFLEVPDHDGFCFTQAFQSIGLGLSAAIGAAIARPDRLTVLGAGDGGFLMSISELETAVRLRLPLLVIVYNDNAYGAETHHFGPAGANLDLVRFPPTDIASIAKGFGCDAITITRLSALDAVRDWVGGQRDRPLVIDAKITETPRAWWHHHAFGH
jgi:acetolactate synthase I/II/III large subunit